MTGFAAANPSWRFQSQALTDDKAVAYLGSVYICDVYIGWGSSGGRGSSRLGGCRGGLGLLRVPHAGEAPQARGLGHELMRPWPCCCWSELGSCCSLRRALWNELGGLVGLVTLHPPRLPSTHSSQPHLVLMCCFMPDIVMMSLLGTHSQIMLLAIIIKITIITPFSYLQ